MNNLSPSSPSSAYVGETDPNASDWDWLLVQTVAHANGTTTTYEYDSNRRVTRIVNEPGNRATSYTYDVEGNRTSMTNVEGNTWYYTYDAYGRLVKTEDPTSATTEIAYNTVGQVTVTTNSEGRATVREYDSDGRLTSVTALGVTTTYAYDLRDRLTTVH